MQFNEFNKQSVEIRIKVQGLENHLIDTFVCSLGIHLSDDEIDSKVSAYLKLMDDRIANNYLTKKTL